MNGRRLLAVCMAALAVIGVGIGAAAVSSTQAAWTDQVHVTATATAGTWSAVGENTCTWWDKDGNAIEGCEITTFTINNSWAGFLQFYLVTSSPANGTQYHVTFEVDLSTAAGAPAPESFDWDGAVITQLTSGVPADDWACTELPVLRGVGGTWQENFSITVAENGASGSNICG